MGCPGGWRLREASRQRSCHQQQATPPRNHAASQPQLLQVWLYGVTAAAVAFFIFSNVRRWWREARAQRLAAPSAGYSSDWA